MPAADDLRSNMVRGGSPKETELTPREREICARLGPHLRERGLLLVGIDVIGGWLTEINVTSPTGIRAVRNVGGPDIAKLVWARSRGSVRCRSKEQFESLLVALSQHTRPYFSLFLVSSVPLVTVSAQAVYHHLGCRSVLLSC